MADRNVQVLSSGVSAVASLLAATTAEDRAAALGAWHAFEEALRAASDIPLADLAARFRLDTFELQVIVLALAGHVEPQLPALAAGRGTQLLAHGATVRMALEVFCDDPGERIGARQAFLPSGRLVRQRLIELERPAAASPDRMLAQRVELTAPTLRRLLQEPELSEPVARVAELRTPDVPLLRVVLPPARLRQLLRMVDHNKRYREVIREWGFHRALPTGRGVTLLFSGPSGTGKTLLAEALATHLGLPLLWLSAVDLPENEGVERVLRDVLAEAAIRDSIVLIDECDALLARTDRRKGLVYKAIDGYEGILVMTTMRPDVLDEGLERRILHHLPFEVPDATLRRQIWEAHLPPEVPVAEDIDLASLAELYDFTGGTIKNAVLTAVNLALDVSPGRPCLTMALLDQGCREQLRYALAGLAERTTTHLRLGDIALPGEADRKVREILAACRNQAVVLNRWGFGRRLVTGKGIVVLFDGSPGTGKTYCAEILAGELDRPLYRVQVPEVVSKWVGETEKNLKAIFQQARISHAMLLFDEADSLFSARVAETRSSNDRYANMEVNLLLQEIERFPGICILTTNSFGALDKALVRRIQFRVTFEEPDAAQRKAIWEVLAPPEAPLAADVDFGVLARRFELTGGMIKNSLIRAAYAAADRGAVIDQGTLVEACRAEYQAAGKVVREAQADGRRAGGKG